LLLDIEGTEPLANRDIQCAGNDRADTTSILGGG
jgi:hypothetical protein